MEATLIPTQDQVQLMLDSPMTDAEQQQLERIESRAKQADQRIVNSKLDKALCLIEVYQDKLFRGKSGGRSWGDYLQSIDFRTHPLIYLHTDGLLFLRPYLPIGQLTDRPTSLPT